jgi:hypothetical protein
VREGAEEAVVARGDEVVGVQVLDNGREIVDPLCDGRGLAFTRGRGPLWSHAARVVHEFPCEKRALVLELGDNELQEFLQGQGEPLKNVRVGSANLVLGPDIRFREKVVMMATRLHLLDVGIYTTVRVGVVTSGSRGIGWGSLCPNRLTSLVSHSAPWSVTTHQLFVSEQWTLRPRESALLRM